MDGINLNALGENATRLGMRIQETIAEHTRDLSLIRGGSSLFDMADDKAKNITKQLESSSDREKLDAMKRLIAVCTSQCSIRIEIITFRVSSSSQRTGPVSSYFPAVVKNVASTNLELRKLVYIYLLRCAPSEPDLALLSINTFQRDLADSSPLIRAMALRVLSGIRVPTVATIVLMAVRKSAADPSPYVRKAAALAVLKVYKLDQAHHQALLDILTTLLRDRSPLSLGTAVLALDTVAPSRLDLLHVHFRRLCRALPDIDAWGQVDVLRVLVRYVRTMLPKPVSASERQGEEVDKDLKLLLTCAEPLFMSKNPAVVLAVARAFYYLAPSSMLSKVAAPLLRILSVSREVERVALAYLLVVARSHPALFVNYHTRLLVRTDDAEQVKRTKICILLTLCTVDNHQALLREFVDYAQDPNDSVVGDAIHAIGRIASLVPPCTPQCLTALMGMINNIIVSNAVLVLKSLVQNQLLTPSSASTTTIATSLSSQQALLTSSIASLTPSISTSLLTPVQVSSTSPSTAVAQAPLSIIAQLARRIDDVRHPHARACVLWLVGQYSPASGTGTTVEGVADWAPDVLRKAARSFNTEASLVKLQTLTLAAKLTLLAPTHRTLVLLARHVLTLARYDEDWDVRDRARMLGALLVGAVAGVVSSNGEEGVGEHWDKEEQAGRTAGVVLRREQVMRVLFEGKTGTIEEEAVTDSRPLGTLSLVMERDGLHLHDDDDDETVVDLPEWLEQGIDPALRDSDDDAPQVVSSASTVQAISSQGISSQRVPTSATPLVLTPTGGSTPKDTKDWRDLDKFYASECESEGEVEDEEDEASGNDEESGEDDEISDNEGDEEDEEEGVAEHDSSSSHERTR
ncbi:adaptin N terminal region-domain-containing protein [Suillus paluster]|uniref:adaptin N terminal region-domain-containing protein n=1 Tax=Suillus paluster TaxID=48578 RepID=UPI001B8724E5|nr:adaptin N terminal region-domain-containing protein [Suillus paluster]KAG1725360.1 adaptin N terminal region-domain-containing protein [Suillus paluster]